VLLCPKHGDAPLGTQDLELGSQPRDLAIYALYVLIHNL